MCFPILNQRQDEKYASTSFHRVRSMKPRRKKGWSLAKPPLPPASRNQFLRRPRSALARSFGGTKYVLPILSPVLRTGGERAYGRRGEMEADFFFSPFLLRGSLSLALGQGNFPVEEEKSWAK